MGGEPAQSSRREASTWTFFDRLDIFSNAIDVKNTLVLLVLPHTHSFGDALNPYRKCNRNCYTSSFAAQVADCSELPGLLKNLVCMDGLFPAKRIRVHRALYSDLALRELAISLENNHDDNVMSFTFEN